MNSRSLFLYLGLFAAAWSCQPTGQIEIPEVDHLLEDLVVVPFGKKIMTTTDTAELDNFLDSNPLFTNVFANQVLSSHRGPNAQARLTDFREDSSVHVLWQSIHSIAPFSDECKDQLALAFALATHHFPQFSTPKVYTCFSEFEVGSFTIGPEVLGIGLDFFLGSSYSYDPILFPEYIAKTMTPEHLVPKSVQVMIEELVGGEWGPSLADQMLRNGLVLYLKKHLLPFVDDTIIHEFSEDEMAWVQDNEREIWAFLISERLLHETNRRKFKKLVSPSPSVPGMPEEAPGRVGNWVGLRIIEAYAQQEGLSLADLLKERDAEKILAKSRYRPRQ